MNRQIKSTVAICALFALVFLFSACSFQVPKIFESKGEEEKEPESQIHYIQPEKAIYASAKQSFEIQVCTRTNAEITVKLGTKSFKSEFVYQLADGSMLYSILCTMPSSKQECQSIGHAKVICFVNGVSESRQGPEIILNDEESTSQFATSAFETTSSSQVQIANNSENEESEEIEAQYIISDENLTSSGKMCRIVSQNADVWPGDRMDDIMSPQYSSLIKGTQAIIKGESSAYDADKKETRQFYDLSCGMRILKSSAELIDEKMQINKFSAAISSSDTLLVSQTWHVPYKISVSPVTFLSKSGKQFFVDDFSAAEVSITFFHSSLSNKKIDVSKSTLFSSAKWQEDSKNQEVTLSLNLKTKGAYYGAEVSYTQSGEMQIKFKNKPSSLSGATILVDPGHGGKDSGALGFGGAVKESDVNFAQSVALKNALEARGARVIFTRYSDEYYTLEQRKDMTLQYKPDLFISIHSNSSVDKSAFGTSVYYYKPMSQPLAFAIKNELVSAFKGIYANDQQKQNNVDRGANYNPFAVTRQDECPSVLIETGFVSNDEECLKLCDAATRDILASHIADGIEQYLAN